MQKQHLQTLHPETVDCTLGGGPSYAVFAKVINIKGSQINSYNCFILLVVRIIIFNYISVVWSWSWTQLESNI